MDEKHEIEGMGDNGWGRRKRPKKGQNGPKWPFWARGPFPKYSHYTITGNKSPKVSAPCYVVVRTVSAGGSILGGPGGRPGRAQKGPKMAKNGQKSCFFDFFYEKFVKKLQKIYKKINKEQTIKV